MTYIYRDIYSQLIDVLNHGKSVLLLGARQTGKTTLIKQIPYVKYISLANPILRQRYEREPGIIINELEALEEKEKTEKLPLIIIDEIQKVPQLLDAVQYLIDNKTAQFILTGSSARKLRNKQHVNFLPGRVIPLYLSPLNYNEIISYKNNITLEELLLFGSLPEIITQIDPNYRERLLNSYVITYLEEEIRLEAVVRNVGQFSRFIELSAAESGKIVNFLKLSQEIGIAHTTIAGFYQILEDCLIAYRIDALSKTKTRRKLQKASKYLFYDLGVRRIAANEGIKPPLEFFGHLLEQYVGLELLKIMALKNNPCKHLQLKYWRDTSGVEVDWVLEINDSYIPIEVKWTDRPNINDAKYLKIFLQEYNVTIAYIVCRTPNRMKLADNIYAIPWQELSSIIDTQ